MILCIGGLDSSGGAGLDRDRRTAESLGCPVRSACTAVTVQGREGVTALEPVSSDMLRRQIEAPLGEDPIKGVKIGALVSAGQISLIGDILGIWKSLRPDLIILADPVFAPTRGLPFLGEEERAVYGELLPLVDVITPNRQELEQLSGEAIATPEEGEAAGHYLARQYDLAVVLTGGHFPGRRITEKVITPECCRTFSKSRLKLRDSHGTGCCLSTTLAVYLSQGIPLLKAFPRATQTVSKLMG